MAQELAVADNIKNNPALPPNLYDTGKGTFDFTSASSATSNNSSAASSSNADMQGFFNSPGLDKKIEQALATQDERSSEIFAEGKKISGNIEDTAKKATSNVPPQPPKIEPYKPLQGTDPWAAFGSPAMTLAIFGSMALRGGVNGALEAGSGVLQAQKDNDIAAAKKHLDDYKEYVDYTKTQYEFERNHYKDLQDKYKDDIAGQKAAFDVASNSFKDTNLNGLLNVKGVAGIDNHIKSMDKTMQDMQNNAYISQAASAAKISVMQRRQAGENITDAQAQDIENKAVGAATAATKGKSMTGDVTMSSSAIDFNARAILAGVPMGTLGLGWGNNPNKIAVENRVAEINPKFDMASAELGLLGSKAEERKVGNIAGTVLYASNALENAIPLAKDAMKGVDLSKFTDYNQFHNYALEHTGDPNISALDLALQTVISDYSALIARTGVQTDSTRATSAALVNPKMAPAQLLAVFKQVEKERTAQLNAVKQTKADIKAEVSGSDNKSEAPPSPGAKKAPDGFWYVPDPARPGKYLKVGQ